MNLENELKTTRFMSDTHKVHLNVLFSASWLRQRIAARIKHFGLTLEQFNTLRIVRGAGHDGLRVKDISARMLDRSSNTTRIIDKLETKNLVKRTTSDKDRRELSIVLTEKGRQLLQDLDNDWETDNPHTSVLTKDECKILNDLLDKLRENGE